MQELKFGEIRTVTIRSRDIRGRAREVVMGVDAGGQIWEQDGEIWRRTLQARIQFKDANHFRRHLRLNLAVFGRMVASDGWEGQS